MKTNKILLSLSIVVIFFNLCFSQENKTMDNETQTMYVVIAGTSANYNSLESLAKSISKKTEIPYDNGLEYDAKRGMIVPDTSSDEIYAGGYYPRRYPEERISIEMMWYYTDGKNNDTLKDMIIITGIFTDKKSADIQLKKVKKTAPTAYIKKTKMYMGCMH